MVFGNILGDRLSIKLLLAIIFIILSLGSLYPWILLGFTEPVPTVPLILLVVGGFFLAGWLKGKIKRKRKIKIDKEKAVIGGLIGATVAGTLIAAVLEEKKREATLSEIRKMEKEIEELYRTGKIDYNKYYELKKKIAELKIK